MPKPRGAYRKIERPGWRWISTCVLLGAVFLAILFWVSTLWGPILEVAATLLSVVGAVILLAATWSSIKTREELCLLTLSRQNPGDFEEVLAQMQHQVDNRVFDDLKREWRFNIIGVVCLLLAIGSFALHTADTHQWI